MTIIFQLTRRDIFIGTLMMILHRRLLVGFLTLLFMIIAIQNLYYISTGEDSPAEIAAICIIQFLPFLIIAGAVTGYTFFTTLSRRNKTMLSKQTITLTEPVMICESEFTKSDVKWVAIQRIVRSGNYLFLYVSELGALMIPKRAFSSLVEWNEFVNYCQEKSKIN